MLLPFHRRLAAGLALAALTLAAHAEVQVKSIRWTEGSRVRLLVDFSATPTYRISRTASRLSIEVDDASPVLALVQPPSSHPAAARVGSLPGKTRHSLNLLVDLKTDAVPRFRTEKLPEGARLVVHWPETATDIPEKKPKPGKSVATGDAPADTLVVAIDAGHGGKDTGAIGPSGIREKDVVLAIARKLAAHVQTDPRMKAVLVRDGDHFIDLHDRAEIARRAGADLFVSLHADAYESGEARGSSIFTLSETGASSEAARYLAEHENDAATLAGIRLEDKSKLLASVLVDLSKNATLEASDVAAAKVLRELKKGFPVHHPEVQKAGFAVLKSLDMPSMLVETAFISNPGEERHLVDPAHQEQLARAVFQGIRAFFAEARNGRGVSVAEVP